MVYDFGLIITIAIGGWLALDYVMAEDWARRSPGIAWLGALGALWAGAEMLVGTAETPAQLALARRLLYLGVYGGTFCWCWVAIGANPPRWYQRSPRRVFLFALPSVALYSTLYWAPDGTLISLYSAEPTHGPLFLYSAAVCWSLIAGGLVYYATTAFKLGRVSQLRAASLLGALLVPLVVNIVYAFGLLGKTDPTPALLGATALMIRFGIVDPGLALYLPLARKDIVEQLAVGVVVADIDGRVVDSNTSARRLLGVDDPRGQPLDALCTSLDETVEALRFPLRSHVTVTGSAAVLTDRREAVESERRLQLAGRIEAVGSLTAGMAHEINNPLAFIRSNLNLIEKLIAELVSPEINGQLPNRLRSLALDGAESLIDAKDGIERISRLVSRLKDFARQTQTEQSKRTLVDLGAAAQRAAAVAGVGAGHDAIRVSVDRDLQVRSEEPVIVQILVNFVLNAVQASHDEADVAIDVKQVSDELAISVSDRGPGLTPEALERIFDPFFTTKVSGSGLGLSISYELAHQLGGRIEAANRPDGGAVFSLYLPMDSPPSA